MFGKINQRINKYNNIHIMLQINFSMIKSKTYFILDFKNNIL